MSEAVRNKVYFLSDIHLGARYIADRREHERKVIEMLRSFSRDASQIYLLGDVLDYWFEYKNVVPRGYIRFFGELARLVDSGIKITWLIGNHDIWMFDYLRNEIGIDIVDGSIIENIDGKTFYLAHGDDLGDELKRSFRILRGLFRNKFCQKMFAGIHPRWTVPLAHKWSSGSRESNSHKYNTWMGDEREPSLVYARKLIKDAKCHIDYIIMGHRHLAVEKDLPTGCRFVLLGDCFEQYTYAEWDGQKLELKQFDTEKSQLNKN